MRWREKGTPPLKSEEKERKKEGKKIAAAA
jgi:hypothetical protein